MTHAERLRIGMILVMILRKKNMYKYGMRLRGFSIGCQPMNGLVNVQINALRTGKRLINGLPDGYPMPINK